jgi:cell division protein FtsB
MKLIVSLLTAFLFFFQTDLEALRNSYAKANLSNANLEAFINIAEKQNGSDAAIKGYKAAAQIMEAKIAKQNRKSLVKSGASNLESIIKANPNNIELRVIRLSVQENIPRIVGYRGGLKDDKAFILNNYSKQNTALKNYIKNFAAQSKTISAEERATLK